MKKRILSLLPLALVLAAVLCAPAFALTEAEVEIQVAASSKEAVTGNVLIWFLCAVAFLKVSQKIDSFMATLGVNVGRTGGSLLAEAMIAMRAVTMVVGGGRGFGAGRAAANAGSAAGKSGASGMAGFFKGGLIGMAGRHITNSAVRTATAQTSNLHTAQSQAAQAAAAAQTSADTHINSEVHTGESSIHTGNAAPTGEPPQDGVIITGSGATPQVVPGEGAPPVDPVPDWVPPQEGVILTGSETPISVPSDGPQPIDTPVEDASAGMTPPQDGVIVMGGESSIHAPQTENVFNGGAEGGIHRENTAVTGGERRTEVHTERAQTTRVPTGGAVRPSLGGMVFSHSLASGGSFANDVIGAVARGEAAGTITGDMAIQSLQSYLGYSAGSKPPPIFSDAEIGGGRMTGYVSTPEHPKPVAFSMYHAGQYTQPTGAFSKVRSADGALWYTQLAQDSVERKPYKAPDGSVAYRERIVKKLPDPPKRKDRI